MYVSAYTSPSGSLDDSALLATAKDDVVDDAGSSHHCHEAAGNGRVYTTEDHEQMRSSSLDAVVGYTGTHRNPAPQTLYAFATSPWRVPAAEDIEALDDDGAAALYDELRMRRDRIDTAMKCLAARHPCCIERPPLRSPDPQRPLQVSRTTGLPCIGLDERKSSTASSRSESCGTQQRHRLLAVPFSDETDDDDCSEQNEQPLPRQDVTRTAPCRFADVASASGGAVLADGRQFTFARVVAPITRRSHTPRASSRRALSFARSEGEAPNRRSTTVRMVSSPPREVAPRALELSGAPLVKGSVPRTVGALFTMSAILPRKTHGG